LSFELVRTARLSFSKAPRHFAGAAVSGQARNEGMLTNWFMAPVRMRAARCYRVNGLEMSRRI
jgi:hypothetical protein